MTISWRFSVDPGAASASVAADVVERRGRGGPTSCRRTRGSAAHPPVGRGVGADDEQLGVGPVDEPRADVDERADHLGHPAALWLRVDERLGVGAGQARADDPGAEHDGGAGDDAPPGG